MIIHAWHAYALADYDYDYVLDIFCVRKPDIHSLGLILVLSFDMIA